MTLTYELDLDSFEWIRPLLTHI